MLEGTVDEGEGRSREGGRRRRRRRGRGRRRGGESIISTTEVRVESVEFTIGADEFEEPLDARIIDVDALPLAEEPGAAEEGETKKGLAGADADAAAAAAVPPKWTSRTRQPALKAS